MTGGGGTVGLRLTGIEALDWPGQACMLIAPLAARRPLRFHIIVTVIAVHRQCYHDE